MSLLSTFVTGHLLHAIETQFVAAEPALQAMLVEEVKELASELSTWLNSKLVAKSE